MRMIKYLFVLMALCASVDAFAQIDQGPLPDWPLKIPRYQRMKGGYGDFQYDRTRNGVLFNGGAYDTYVTYDSAKTWDRVFDWKMFYVDVFSRWRITDNGAWFYNGRIYLRWSMNLVTDDACETMRYLVNDSGAVPFANRLKEGAADIYRCGVASYAIAMLPDVENKSGTYISCDRGYTWKHIPDEIVSPTSAHFMPDDKRLVFYNNGKYIEFDPCDVTKPPVDSDVPVGFGEFYRRADGLVVFSTTGGTFHYRKPGSMMIDTITQVSIPGRDPLKIAISGVSPLTDDQYVVVTTRGEVLVFDARSYTIKPIAAPKWAGSVHTISQMGRNGDLMLIQHVIPIGRPGHSDNWTLYNIKTGEVKSYERAGDATALSLYQLQQKPLETSTVMPVTDSTWMMSLQTSTGETVLSFDGRSTTSASATTGELIITYDAGRTWEFVDWIERDTQWDSSWVNFTRIIPRADGRLSFLTNSGRLVSYNDDRGKYTIGLTDPFVNTFRKFPGEQDTSLAYATDFNGRRRLRYGEPTLFFESADTVWSTGDAVLRWSLKGDFIDTVMSRNSQRLGRLTDKILFAGDDSTWVSWNNGKEWVFVSRDWPKYTDAKDTVLPGLGDLAISNNGTLIAGLRGIRIDQDSMVADSIPGGLLRSVDMGNTWERIYDIPEYMYMSSIKKLPSGTLLAIGVDVVCWPGAFLPVVYGGTYYRRDLQTLILKDYRFMEAYIYRSSDDGMTWNQVHIFPRRSYLPESDLRLIPGADGRVFAINPEYGLVVSDDDGITWATGDPLNLGYHLINDMYIDDEGNAHFATPDGYAVMKSANITSVHEDVHVVTGGLHLQVDRDGYLRFHTGQLPTHVSVVTIDGRTLVNLVDENGIQHVDMSGVARGTYIVSAYIGTERKSGVVYME